jgi:hypothetical protein
MLAVLGAISAQQAAQEAMATAPKYSSSYESDLEGDISAFQIGGFESAGCTNQPAPNLQLFQTASGLTLSAAGAGVGIATATGAIAAGSVAGSVVPVVGTIVGTIVGIFAAIFQHHAAAVKKEQSVLCAAVPAANNYLSIIQQAVAAGTVTPQEGIDALNSLLSDFKSQISSVVNNDSSQCNAGCMWDVALTAICDYWISQFQDMAAQPAATGTTQTQSAVAAGAASPATVATGSTSWVPLAAAAVVIFFVFKGGL